ncbi:hypothetical protein [Kribbella catacumbae]|uniref:hypothetical protein n=1 Tax=Kribbella catacumbae TaxID=460086 RepID=UPI00036BE7DC|nr:hypothetical protein [Kribbella catacumbae]
MGDGQGTDCDRVRVGPATAGTFARLTTDDHRKRGDIMQARGYIRKHFLMNEAELARARKAIVDTARQLGVQLTAIHVEEIETSPEALHDLLAAVMKDEQKMIIAPGTHHFEVAGEPASVIKRLEGNGITVVVVQ